MLVYETVELSQSGIPRISLHFRTSKLFSVTTPQSLLRSVMLSVFGLRGPVNQCRASGRNSFLRKDVQGVKFEMPLITNRGSLKA